MATSENSIKIHVHVHTRGRDLPVAVQEFLDQGFVTLEVGDICFFFSSLDQLAQLQDGINQVADFLQEIPF